MFIHSLVDGPLGSFQFVAILSKATMNILVQIFVWTVISFMDIVFDVVSKRHHNTQGHLGYLLCYLLGVL